VTRRTFNRPVLTEGQGFRHSAFRTLSCPCLPVSALVFSRHGWPFTMLRRAEFRGRSVVSRVFRAGKEHTGRLLARHPEFHVVAMTTWQPDIAAPEAGKRGTAPTARHGPARPVRGQRAALWAFLFLEHGIENQIEPLPPREALHRSADHQLALVASYWLTVMLDGCNRLVNSVPAWRFSFAPTPSAAESLAEFLGCSRADAGCGCHHRSGHARCRPLISTVDNPAFCRLARSLIADGKMVRCKAAGASMFPWIQDGDLVTLSPSILGASKPGQIIAFENACGSLTIHRLVATRSDITLHPRYAR